ncbi:MAG: hypothetical protein NVS4B8_18120 [Herpetosiphon sp.]
MSGRSVGAAGLVALLFGVWLTGFLAPTMYRLPLDRPIGIGAGGFGQVEQGEGKTFRWTSRMANLLLPRWGTTPSDIHLTFHSPMGRQHRTVQIRDHNRTLAAVVIRPGWQTVQLVLPTAQSRSWLEFVTDPPFEANGRTLGIAVRALSIRQISGTSVPLRVVAAVLGLALLVMTCGAASRMDVRRVLWAGAATAIVGLLGVSWLRVPSLIVLPILLEATTLAVILAAALTAWTWRWETADARPWLANLRVVAAGLFVARVAGLWHPQFQIIDHIARIHHIQSIAQGNQAQVAAGLANQFEWGSKVVVPYSLWGYYPFVPLAYILSTDQLLMAVEGISAALEATVPLLLYRIVSCAGRTPRQGWWAGVVYAALPIGFLFYHDGSFPTIIGLWTTVVALRFVQMCYERPRWRFTALAAAGIGVSMLLYVTQLGFVPLLVGLFGASVWLYGGRTERGAARRVMLALGLGTALALVLYYGRVLPEMVKVTVPLLWNSVRSNGSVGGVGSKLPGALTGSFWQQAWGHFRWIGLALALAGAVIAAKQRGFLRHLGIAYLVFVVVTVLVDTRVGLWNKHLYWALPGVAIFAGFGLAEIGRRGRSAQWLARGLLVVLMLSSLHAWIVRVLFYEWSLRTL